MTTGRLYRAPRRWPALVSIAAAGAVVGGGVVAATLTMTNNGTATSTTPVTVTSEPPTSPSEQRPEQANRQTCAGWDAAGKLINEAADALKVLPEGTSILAPEVRDDPSRTAAVQHASELFAQAADALAQASAPGAAEILEQAAITTVGSLKTLATAYRDFDDSSGDAITTARAAAHNMSGLCKRLVG